MTCSYMQETLSTPQKNLRLANSVKAAWYKINRRKAAFLYISKKLSKKEIKKIITFTWIQRKIKYL